MISTAPGDDQDTEPFPEVLEPLGAKLLFDLAEKNRRRTLQNPADQNVALL
jgi:hypothetical protein